MKQQLEKSEEANHWANFGPVSRELEQQIHAMIGAPDDLAVVCASSATAALIAVNGLFSVKAGRTVRWAASSFGFIGSQVNSIDVSAFVDCNDHDAQLSLEDLKRVPRDSYDGVLSTRVFGRGGQREVARFCSENGKLLLVDGATALDYDRHTEAVWPCEVISFHHTKPWGFGEGGCAIVPREDEATLRGILNFGVGAPAIARRSAANGKMSDVSAAFILGQLAREESWKTEHWLQYRRIEALCSRVDVGILGSYRPPSAATPAHVPVMKSAKSTEKGLNLTSIVQRKYYRPLSATKNASDIFDHVVCIPCHKDLLNVGDTEILQILDP